MNSMVLFFPSNEFDGLINSMVNNDRFRVLKTKSNDFPTIEFIRWLTLKRVDAFYGCFNRNQMILPTIEFIRWFIELIRWLCHKQQMPLAGHCISIGGESGINSQAS
jgi:hypothetical protein